MFQYRNKFLASIGVLIFTSGTTLPALSSDTGQIQITATVTAECTLSAPALVEVDNVPYTALAGLAGGEELTGYDKTFTITTTCSGTNKYSLLFIGQEVGYGCLVGGNIGFCLYQPNGEKINLASSTSRNVSAEGSTFDVRVVPARIGNPAPGVGTGTLTVTISPL